MIVRRELVLKFQKLVLKARADQRVERREGFVHQKDRRLGREGAGEADALLHAAGKFADLALGPVRQADERQLLIDLLASLRRTLAREFEPEADILAHRPPRQQAELLEHHRHAFAPDPEEVGHGGMANLAGPALVMDRDLAAADRVEPVDRPQKRRLAGTGKPHQHEDLAGLDRQRTIVDAEDLAGLALDLGALHALRPSGAGARSG